MYTRFKSTHSDHLIPAQIKCPNTRRGNLLQQKYLQNLNAVFAVVTHGHTTMASVLLRARSVLTAPNTTILPVCVTPKLKSEKNSTRIPPMQYGMIFDRPNPTPSNNSNCSSDESSDSDENAFTINEVQTQPNTGKKQRSFIANLKIGKSIIPFQIDSGSSVNIIDETTFQRIKKSNPNIVLRKSRKRLFGFGGQTPLPLVGQFESVLESKKRITSAKIVVVKGTTGCLLSG